MPNCKQFRFKSSPKKHNARSGSRLYDTLMVFSIPEIIFLKKLILKRKSGFLLGVRNRKIFSLFLNQNIMTILFNVEGTQ